MKNRKLQYVLVGLAGAICGLLAAYLVVFGV